MAPKNIPNANEERILFGRPSNNLKMGIVGLPNVGKSTLFNVLTDGSMPAGNFPFCTIDPAESRVSVPDPRFEWLCDFFKPDSKKPAYLTVYDIAGLVKGASKGHGLGNAFLSHIKAVDGIFHVVRAFNDESIEHVEGDVNPIRDLEIIHEELRLKDVEFLKKQMETAAKGMRGNESDKTKKLEYETMCKALDVVSNQMKEIRHASWSSKEVHIINTLQLLTAKSVVYLTNITQEDFVSKKNKWLPKIKGWIDKNSPGDVLIPFSASFEGELASSGSSGSDKKEAESKLGASSALPKIIVAGYNALSLCYFFTSGPDEVGAWTIRKGSKAPQAAGVIHSDFERGFIAAEVMKFEDLRSAGSEAAVKAAGKYMIKGKDYPVEDGDIVFFKFNVTGKKK